MELGHLNLVVPPTVERTPVRPPATGTPGQGQASFVDALGKALGQVEALQLNADRESTELANGGGNLHETALALEKADVAMRLATKVRNRFVEAYQEVMRMQV